MKALVPLVVLLVCLCSAVLAADLPEIDESKLSPEAKALKARYDAAIKQLQEQFAAELKALSERVDKVSQPAAPAKKPWYDNILINGYFQARFWAREYDTTTNERDDFGIRRFYMNVIGTNPKGQFVATYCGTGPDFRENAVTRWENMFVEYWPNKELSVRAGLCPTFFGLDDAESSSWRLTPERAMVLEGSPTLGLVGLYPTGPSDMGVWVIYDDRPKPRQGKPGPHNPGWRLDFTVHNGQFEKTDKDNYKNIGLDAEYFFDWGQAGASWLNGKFTRTPTGAASPVTEDRKAFGLNFRVFPNTLVKNWGFQGEWVDGKWYGTDRRGWYGQASYHFPGSPNIAYTRYEEFDPNRAAANDRYEAWHVGYKYYLTPQDELTVEYTDGTLAHKDTNDLILQYQRAF